MKAFFGHLFECDRLANLKWIEAIDEQDVTSFNAIRKQMCHILNVHHLWVSRLHQKSSISEKWDDLPFYSWKKLNEENFQLTMDFIENESLQTMISFQTTEGEVVQKEARWILYHLLQHATHHRAVINSLLTLNRFKPVEHDFMSMDH